MQKESVVWSASLFFSVLRKKSGSWSLLKSWAIPPYAEQAVPQGWGVRFHLSVLWAADASVLIFSCCLPCLVGSGGIKKPSKGDSLREHSGGGSQRGLARHCFYHLANRQGTGWSWPHRALMGAYLQSSLRKPIKLLCWEGIQFFLSNCFQDPCVHKCSPSWAAFKLFMVRVFFLFFFFFGRGM